MEAGHLDTEIVLEEGDFDNLSFPLVSDGSVTTDGSLLSGITTDTIRDDLAQHLTSEHQVHAVTNNIADGTHLADLFVTDNTKPMTFANDVMLTTEPQNSNLLSWQNDGCIITSSDQKSRIYSTFGKSNLTSSVQTHTVSNRIYSAASSLSQSKRNIQTTTLGINQACSKINPNVTQAAIGTLQTSHPVTLKVPIQTSLGKSFHLHLIAKGVTPSQHITNTIPLTTLSQQTLQPDPSQHRTSSLVLLKDKSTGKSFLVPSGSPLFLTQPPPLTIQPLDNQTAIPCEGPSLDLASTFEGIDILDPQPVIDVNEFLNIPPKITDPENNVEIQLQEKTDIIRADSELCIDSVSHCNIQPMVNSNISASGNESELGTGLFSEKGESLDTDLHTTGEDLIKMMAVKVIERKTDDTVLQTENEEHCLFSEDSGDIDNAGNYSVDITCHQSNDTKFQTTKTATKGQGVGDVRQVDSSISETEERIASIVPDSMRDFVRDIFEDEDALDKDYIQAIMDETVGPNKPDSDMALSPSDIAKHAVEKLSQSAENIGKLTSAISVQIDKYQLVMVSGQKRWKCNICPKMYSTKHNLVTHILDHCEIKPHCCVICGKLFKQPSHLYTHMLTHKTVKPYTCKICNRSFTQASHLKRHSAVHLEKRPHMCDICNQGFSYPSELKNHKERHKLDQSLECEKCGEAFESSRKLKNHVASQHKDTNDLTCKDCGKVCVFPSQLRDHVLKHTGARPFICTECGMDFIKEHHLKAHQFTHTGHQPFKCKVCSRSFNQKANLQRHYLIHETSKKFKCPECGREFSQPQVMKSHLQTHSGKKPFKCKECGKTFSRQHNLNGHMTLHQGDKRYVCFCGASFTLKGNLNRHKKTKHNMEACDETPPDNTAEEMAPETAAHILNMMSAKRFLLSSNQSDNIIAQDEDSHLTKNKRKSVPRKSIVSEDNDQLPEVKETKDTDLMQYKSEISEHILANNNEIINKRITPTGQEDAVSPAKRKQLNPQFIQCKLESDAKLKTKSSVVTTPGSTRRKQKAVVKTDLINLDSETEIQDEAEQEWQGTSSRDGMENTNSMDNVENTDTSGNDSCKTQIEMIPPLLTIDMNPKIN